MLLVLYVKPGNNLMFIFVYIVDAPGSYNPYLTNYNT